MRVLVGAAAALIAVTGFAQPERESRDVTGNALHDLCTSRSGVASAPPACFWYVMGVLDGGRYARAVSVGAALRSGSMPAGLEKEINRRLYCGDDVTYGQLVDITRKFLVDHPELRHHPAPMIVEIAVSTALPCK